jgi:hypothetical protein
VKLAAAVLIATASLGAARVTREAAKGVRAERLGAEPYAPTPAAAPIVSIGYRELMADLLFVRLAGYFGDTENTANGVASLAEAIAALDPRYQRIYEWGARAMTIARQGVDQQIYLRAVALLEAGARQFPTNWRLPNLAGQIYLLDLETKDPAQRRAWDERGTLLVEAAIRKPGAPAEAATLAAVMRSKLGQHQRAVDGLREMLLVTGDDKARRRIIEKLAELEHEDADELAAEVLDERGKFERMWHAERPAINPSLYLIVGARISTGFDPADLATGGHDLVQPTTVERLEPLQ